MKEARKAEILNLLKERRFLTVKTIGETLFVSLPTVRRDLTALAQEGVIIRCHGGAVLPDENHVALPYAYRMEKNKKEKQKMCRAAASLVRDGDVIFIDESSSAAWIPRFLEERKSLTVVTNAMPLSEMLSGLKDCTVYYTGGKLSESGAALTGEYVEDFIGGILFDKVFFSVFGVREDGTLVETADWKRRLIKLLRKRGKTMVCLADREKFGVDAPYTSLFSGQLDVLITDEDERNHAFRPGKW
ncbi:MAG: DeoR/GlpR family DNA-binding transcription regulator, partial [Clostridia bacterium]|nr:DeoR/GlpR family DNA-binding transcription regulator [Clostridia bacterium]